MAVTGVGAISQEEIVKFSAILCGCGAMSKGWLRAIASNPLLADSITIVGLVDLNRETAEKLAAEFEEQFRSDCLISGLGSRAGHGFV